LFVYLNLEKQKRVQDKVKIKPIKGFNCFSILYVAGVKIRLFPILASVCYNLEDSGLNELWSGRLNRQANTMFFGVTVSKKVNKKAVNRNRIKRLMRESIRLVIDELVTSGEEIQIKTIILSWKSPIAKPADIALKDVLPLIRETIKTANNR
jgi:ribonuclease P protein component